MKSNAFLSPGVCLVIVANAPVANANCYSIYEQYFSCDPNQHYCSYYEKDTCIIGCQGPVCSTGYGYCCDHSYSTQIVSGDPADIACRNGVCGTLPVKGQAAIDRQSYANLRPASSVGGIAPKPAYYVPSACVGVCGIMEPAEPYIATSGM
jgi:hypothetical protein